MTDEKRLPSSIEKLLVSPEQRCTFEIPEKLLVAIKMHMLQTKGRCNMTQLAIEALAEKFARMKDKAGGEALAA